jgi:hypothetical protein
MISQVGVLRRSARVMRPSAVFRLELERQSRLEYHTKVLFNFLKMILSQTMTKLIQ